MTDTTLQWGPPDTTDALEDAWPVARAAVDTFGASAQRVGTLEECGELIAALAQESRGRRVDVPTEIADVMLMCLQLAYLYGDAKVAEEIRAKTARIRARILSELRRQ